MNAYLQAPHLVRGIRFRNEAHELFAIEAEVTDSIIVNVSGEKRVTEKAYNVLPRVSPQDFERPHSPLVRHANLFRSELMNSKSVLVHNSQIRAEMHGPE